MSYAYRLQSDWVERCAENSQWDPDSNETVRVLEWLVRANIIHHVDISHSYVESLPEYALNDMSSVVMRIMQKEFKSTAGEIAWTLHRDKDSFEGCESWKIHRLIRSVVSEYLTNAMKRGFAEMNSE